MRPEMVGLREKAMRHHRGRGVAMVFQDPTRSLNPTMRVGAQIREAIQTHENVSRASAQDRALELLELVRLPAARERLEQYPHQLSGGMRQRVMIAIALAAKPKLLIADEATTALDVTTQAQIMELLRDLQQRLGMALIMISHDLGLAASFADEVVVMYAGRAVERAADPEAVRPRPDAVHASAARRDPAPRERLPLAARRRARPAAQPGAARARLPVHAALPERHRSLPRARARVRGARARPPVGVLASVCRRGAV